MKTIDLVKTASYKSIYLEFLDFDDNIISDATGFIVGQSNELLFFTCWHSCTGYNFLNKTRDSKKPEKIKMYLPFVYIGEDTLTGRLHSVVTNLYSKEGKPIWFQENSDKITHDGVPIPNTLDVAIFILDLKDTSDEIITRLPNNVIDSESIYDEETVHFDTKAFVFGYPFGLGAKKSKDGIYPLPEAVRYTRNIATPYYRNFHGNLLLDGSFTPTMSGSPVYVRERDNIYLMGMYGGELNPANNKGIKNNDKGSLGIVYKITDISEILKII